MPYVNIKVTDEGCTTEQKKRLIEGVTNLLEDVLGKDPKTTFVIIDDDISTDNWGIGGKPVTDIRKMQASALDKTESE